MADEIQQVTDTKTVKGSLTVSFTKPTPMWATWVFRVVFLINKAAAFVISGEDQIPDDMKVRIFLYMSAVDFIVWGIAQGLGIKKQDFEEPK